MRQCKRKMLKIQIKGKVREANETSAKQFISDVGCGAEQGVDFTSII